MANEPMMGAAGSDGASRQPASQQAAYGQQAAGQTAPQQQAAGYQQPASQHAAYGQQPTPAAHQTAERHGAHAAYGQQQEAPAPGFIPVTPEGGNGKQKKGTGGLKTFLLGAAGAAVACVVVLAIAFGTGMLSTGTTLGATTSTPITASEEDSTLAEQVANKALPSVAAITVYAQQSTGGGSLFDYLYGYDYGGGSGSEELVEYSQGSGVVLSADGYILTNQHVVSGGSSFEVTVDGQTYTADLVGYDSSSDIAVLKCQNASGLTPIEIGDSDSISVGDWVMTIGSPFGLEQSVATGIVSATSRSQIMTDDQTGSTTVYTNLIQTDAAINPGNSGGALVNDQGQLIGINTLITSYSGNYSGVGFAIPVNYAMGLAEQIINGETPTHASLGVTMTTIDAQTAERYGFAADAGAYVTAVEQGSGAEAAGIVTGDIITAVDGEQISDATDLQLAIRSHNPGDEVTLTINRDGQTMDVRVTLGENADETASATQQESMGSNGGSGSLRDLLGGGSESNGNAA